MTSRGQTTFTPADPSVVDGDPFWSVVLREQPDLELILVGGPAEPEVVEEAPEPVVSAAIDQLVATWRLLRPLVATADRTDPDRPPSARWCADGLLVQRAVVGAGLEAGTDLLRAVAVALGEAGWLLRPSAREGDPLLEATSEGARLVAEAGPGATVLALHSPPLAVPPDRRSALHQRLAQELSA